MPLLSRVFSHARGDFRRVSRVSLDGLKSERLLVAGNKALVVMQSRVKLVRIALIPRGGKGVAFISKRKKRSQKISTVFQILEFCRKSNWKMSTVVYMYRRFIVTRFWTVTLSGLNCLTAWWERRRSWDSFFIPSTVGKSKATLLLSNISFTHRVAVFTFRRFFYERRRGNGPMGMWH